MRPSLMFGLSVAFAFVIGCGGGDGESQPDAKVFMDAPPPPPDAAIMASEGLGKVCNQQMPCPTQTPPFLCAVLNQANPNGFCTKTCGTTAETQMMPPADGNMICQQIMPASPEGTPGCVLTAPPMNGMKDWACALLCGTANGMNFGNCPAGLTCTSNVCQ